MFHPAELTKIIKQGVSMLLERHYFYFNGSNWGYNLVEFEDHQPDRSGFCRNHTGELSEGVMETPTSCML